MSVDVQMYKEIPQTYAKDLQMSIFYAIFIAYDFIIEFVFLEVKKMPPKYFKHAALIETYIHLFT